MIPLDRNTLRGDSRCGRYDTSDAGSDGHERIARAPGHGGRGHVHHDEHAAGGSGSRGGHGGHTGHGDHVGQFRRLFWINLVISVPVVASSPMFAMILGYTVPQWALLVGPALGTVMYAWGGWPFLSGAVSELRSRTPGMMLLIGLAITVAFFASWGATVGILDHALEFWWELALLIVVMLLGHWIEMRSLAQTTSALDSLAAPAEQTAVECGESLIEHGVA